MAPARPDMEHTTGLAGWHVMEQGAEVVSSIMFTPFFPEGYFHKACEQLACEGTGC